MIVSFAKSYRDLWEREKEAWIYNSKHDSDEAIWTRPATVSPVSVVLELRAGLDALYAGRASVAKRFFVRAILKAAKIETILNVSRTGPSARSYPRNLGEVRIAVQYCRLITGEGLDRAGVRAAASLIREWLEEHTTSRERANDSTIMCWWMRLLRVDLIAADLDAARRTLELTRKVLWSHGVEHGLLERLLAEYPNPSAGLRSDFEAFFDRVRDPEYRDIDQDILVHTDDEMRRFELSIIRQMYLVNKSLDAPVDPKAVIAAVCA